MARVTDPVTATVDPRRRPASGSSDASAGSTGRQRSRARVSGHVRPTTSRSAASPGNAVFSNGASPEPPCGRAGASATSANVTR